jgi:hypothetical protein
MIRRCMLLIALLLALCLPAQAEPDPLLAPVEQALAEPLALLTPDVDAPFARAAYEIALTGPLSEAAQPFYGEYVRVIVVEYGYYEVYPILSSQLLAVGVKADGSLEPCLTPGELLARTYDRTLLRDLPIQPLAVE